MAITGTLALIAALALEPGALVRGRVVDAETDAPVSNAIIHVSGSRYTRLTFTDSAGQYLFGDVPAGDYVLHVSHPGFDPASIRFTVAGGLGVELEIPVTLRPIPRPGISVVVRQGTRSRTGDGGTGDAATEAPSATRRWLTAGPQSASGLSEMAAARAAATPPDRQGREGAHVLYIWGSTGEQGRVLLDGATLNAPLHLGGMLAPIDPDLVELAEPRSGGASPRFDGGTTQVLELATRPADGDRLRSWIEIDPVASRAGLETPVTAAGGLFVGGRRVNAGLLEQITGRSLGYGYADLLLRSDWRVSAATTLSATAFTTDESVTIPRDFDEDRAAWRNLAAALRWQRDLDGGERGIGLSWSRAAAELPMLTSAAARGESVVERLAFNIDQWWQTGRWRTAIGFEAERLWFERKASAGGVTRCGDAAECFGEGIAVLSPWGQLVLEPVPGLRLSGGARLAYNTRLRRLDPLPRAAITMLLGQTTAITASAGRYSRSSLIIPGAGPLVTGTTTSDPDTTEAAVKPAIARATHFEVSLARRTMTMASGATLLVRRHDALATSPAYTTPGIDLWYALSGAAGSASIGYSFARPGGAGRDLPARHMLAASYSRSAGPITLHVSSAWARGLPWVTFVLEEPGSTLPVVFDRGAGVTGGASQGSEDYIRLDAALSASWTLNLPGGRPSLFAPYVRLMNALGRRDALFYYQEAGADGGMRPLAKLPLVPALGVRWSF